MKPTNWKREAKVWRKCADRLAKAVEHYRGEDWRHGGVKSKALSIYRTMSRRRVSPNKQGEPRPLEKP
jgi:hypothetical protein